MKCKFEGCEETELLSLGVCCACYCKWLKEKFNMTEEQISEHMGASGVS